MKLLSEPSGQAANRLYGGEECSLRRQHQNARLRILAMYSPDGMPNVFIGRGSNSAGIQNHQLGLMGGHSAQTSTG